MTGVSVNGNAIFDVPTALVGSEGKNPFVSAVFDLLSRPFFRVFSVANESSL
jgi:hypothetical protein